MLRKLSVLLVALACARAGAAQNNPTPMQGDFVLKNFRFISGEMLPELRVHYRTFGKPVRDAQGVVRNAVLIMHGTTGSGASLINPEFAGQLFGPAGLLDMDTFRGTLNNSARCPLSPCRRPPGGRGRRR